MICPKCSSNIDDNSPFCPVCGLDIADYDNKLKEEAEKLKIEDATSKINAISTFNHFADIYKDKYIDLFSIFETQRTRKLLQLKLSYLYTPLSIFILIGMWYFIPIINYTIPLIFISLFLVIMLIFSLIRCKTNFTKKYIDELKEPYNKFLYDCFGIKTTITYKRDKMFSLLKKSNLFLDFNNICSSKSYGFIFNNNEIHIEDLDITRSFCRGAFPIFNGILITIENNNKNTISTIIATTLKSKPFLIYIILLIMLILGILSGIPTDNYNWIFQIKNLLFLPIILILIVIFFIRNKHACLNINNKEFSKKYIVESLDIKQAEKYSTEDFYKILKDFESAYDAKDVKIANFENKTVIAIGTNKKFLETIDLRHSLYDPQCFEKTYSQIFSIICLIRFINKE